jgi:hypothetical protein
VTVRRKGSGRPLRRLAPMRDREAYVSKDPFERLLPPRGSGAPLRNEGGVQCAYLGDMPFLDSHLCGNMWSALAGPVVSCTKWNSVAVSRCARVSALLSRSDLQDFFFKILLCSGPPTTTVTRTQSAIPVALTLFESGRSYLGMLTGWHAVCDSRKQLKVVGHSL